MLLQSINQGLNRIYCIREKRFHQKTEQDGHNNAAGNKTNLALLRGLTKGGVKRRAILTSDIPSTHPAEARGADASSAQIFHLNSSSSP